MEIIRERERVVLPVEYRLGFEYLDCPGSGFSFPCDENGNVNEGELNPDALRNYRACVSGTADHGAVRETGITKFENSYIMPRAGRCQCGEEVELDSFTNTCHGCGRDYNWSGHELAPREQWGCETGEHWSDIVRGGDPFDTDY